MGARRKKREKIVDRLAPTRQPLSGSDHHTQRGWHGRIPATGFITDLKQNEQSLRFAASRRRDICAILASEAGCRRGSSKIRARNLFQPQFVMPISPG
jgi:hypothetical protein